MTATPTAPSAVNLAALLVDHPFDDGVPLLHGVEPAVEISAGDARARTRAFADELARSGVAPREAVAVQLPDEPSTVIAMAGVWLAGCVLVPVNARWTDAEVARVVDATRPAAIVRVGGIERVPGAPRRYDDGVAFVLWTSGTTGAPKPILHTHHDYLELLDRVLGPLRGGVPRANAPSPNLIPVTLAANAGIYNVLFGLRAGAPIVVLGAFTPERFAAAVRRFEIRSTVLPPAAIAMLADAPGIDDLTPLRYVRSITAPLAPRVARRFADRFGVFVLNSYGQAELGEVIGWTARDAKDHPEKLGAAGRAHTGVAIRLADADADGVGRLLVRPPAMAHGTADGTSDLVARTDADGFVDTGDLARVDDDGFVWIEGRVSDLINRGGNKIVPDEVEDVLRDVPGVRDAAVVGVADERLGEVPVAAIVVDGDADVGDAAIVAACRECLAPYKVPVRFVRVDLLPRNEAGKLLRRDVAARLGAP